MYGQAPLVGSTIDPRLFIHDFSTLNKANELKAQGTRDLGATIAQGVTQVGDYFKEKKKETSQINALKKSTESRIDSAINLFGDKMPGLAEQLQSQKALLNDPNISLYEQGLNASTIGSEIENTLNMLLQSQQMGIRQAAANRAAAPPTSGGPQGQAVGYTVP